LAVSGRTGSIGEGVAGRTGLCLLQHEVGVVAWLLAPGSLIEILVLSYLMYDSKYDIRALYVKVDIVIDRS
jgi:hypothetical protein